MSDLHITVGTSNMSSGLALDSELRLLKAAVLYGDKVKLCSMGASLILVLAQAANLNERQRMEAIKQWSSALGADYADTACGLSIIQSLRNKRNKSKQEIIALAKAQRSLDGAWEQVVAKIGEMVDESGAEGIADAYHAGILEVEIYDFAKPDLMVRAFFDSVGEAVASGETLPLFDDSTGGLIRAAIREGQLTPGNPSPLQGKVVGLASDLLGRLPLFDDVSMKEILAIRRELEPHLTRFRSAVTSYARLVEAAQWEAGFKNEAELIFQEKVAPAIQDLEDAVKSNTLLKTLLARSTQSLTVQGTTSGLGLLLSGVAELTDIAGAALGFGLGTAVVGGQAITEWRDKHKQNERNQLYFYYQAGQQLGKRL